MLQCSPPGSSVHGISKARILEWGCHFLLQEIFPTQRSNLHLLHLQADFFFTDEPSGKLQRVEIPWKDFTLRNENL